MFTALALVGMLILPLNNFPWILNAVLEAKVSLDRIQNFLELSDQNLDDYYSKGMVVMGVDKQLIHLNGQNNIWFMGGIYLKRALYVLVQ